MQLMLYYYLVVGMFFLADAEMPGKSRFVNEERSYTVRRSGTHVPYMCGYTSTHVWPDMCVRLQKHRQNFKL